MLILIPLVMPALHSFAECMLFYVSLRKGYLLGARLPALREMGTERKERKKSSSLISWQLGADMLLRVHKLTVDRVDTHAERKRG